MSQKTEKNKQAGIEAYVFTFLRSDKPEGSVLLKYAPVLAEIKMVPISDEALKEKKEAYSAEYLKDVDDIGLQNKLFESSGISTLEIDQETLPTNIPAKEKKIIEKHIENCLDSSRYETRGEKIQGREEITEFFEKNILKYNEEFKAGVEKIIKALPMFHQEDYPKIPGYLSRGPDGWNFLYEKDKEKFVIQYFNNEDVFTLGCDLDPLKIDDFRPMKILDKVEALRKIEGMPNAEQLEAFSFSDRVIVKKYIPGEHCYDLFVDKKQNMPVLDKKEFKQLIETVIELDKAGVVPDYSIDNVIYDSKNGFSITDCFVKEKVKENYHLGGLVHLVRLMSIFGKCEYDPKEMREKGRKGCLAIEKQAEAYLPEMVKFLKFVNENYPQLIVKKMENYEIEEMICGGQDRIGFSVIEHNKELKPYVEKIKKLIGIY